MPPILGKTVTLQRLLAVGVQDLLILLALVAAFFATRALPATRTSPQELSQRLIRIATEGRFLAQVAGALAGDPVPAGAEEDAVNLLATLLPSAEGGGTKRQAVQLASVASTLFGLFRELEASGIGRRQLPQALALAEKSHEIERLSERWAQMSRAIRSGLEAAVARVPRRNERFRNAVTYGRNLAGRYERFSKELAVMARFLDERSRGLADQWRRTVDPSVPVPSFSLSLFARLLLIFGICRFFLHYNGLCETRIKQSFREFIVTLAQALGESALLLGLFYFFVPPLEVGVSHEAVFLLSGFGGIFLFVGGWRFLFDRLETSDTFLINLAIFGEGQEACRVAETVGDRPPYRIVGFFSDEPISASSRLGYPHLGNSRNLQRWVRQKQIDEIVVALAEYRGKLPTKVLLDIKLSGIKVTNYTDFFERFNDKIPLENLNPSWIIFSDGFQQSQLQTVLKRQLDLLLGVVGLLLSAPLALVITLLIRLDSKGPILYRQERVGQHGEPFTILKFRTMVANAEEDTGPVWAQKNDARVTRIGRFLRQSRLDEIPQIINVLKGEMSFVGPRPERPVFVEELAREIPFYKQRHYVKPGITGWAQVRYTYAATVEDNREKLMYDLYYIKHMSLRLDLRILFETIRVVVRKMGGW